MPKWWYGADGKMRGCIQFHETDNWLSEFYRNINYFGGWLYAYYDVVPMLLGLKTLWHENIALLEQY